MTKLPSSVPYKFLAPPLRSSKWKNIKRLQGKPEKYGAHHLEKMKGTLFQPLLKYIEENGSEEEEENVEKSAAGEETEGDEFDDIAESVQYKNLQKDETTIQGDDPPRYGLWLQEQKSRAARLHKHLKSTWALENLILQHLYSYEAHFNRAFLSARPQDLAQLLMPQQAPPQELASMAWLGDWRPSAILGLIRAQTCSSPSFSGSDSTVHRLLPQLIRELRVEETVVEEEMAEIQATCVLHLPFATMNHRRGGAALRCIHSEFKKIHGVIAKAQNLRLKALEMVVNKVLNQAEAAEFLVAFAGIQEAIHQYAAHQRVRKGEVSLCVKAVGNSQS